MTERRPSTRALIDDLVADLAPVRRFPSLGAAVGVVVLAWAVGAGLAWRLFAVSPAVVAGRVASEPLFSAVLLGLSVAALAGCAAAVAGVTPGRESLEGRARWIAWAGLVVGVGAAGAVTLVAPGATPLSKDAVCFALGVAVGVPPVLLLVVLERWGFVQRPARSAALALLGAFALGGVAVQIGCHDPGARHVLLGHTGVPLVMTALIAGPLALLVGRFAARSRTRR